MIAEDAENWRDLLTEVFKSRGIEFKVVESSEAVKEALEKGGYTEVITDGLKGKWVDVARRAKQHGLPVKLLSGEDEYKEAAEKAGVPFFQKFPLNIRELIGR